MQKTTTSKWVDDTVSSRISEKYVGIMAKSNCDLSSAQQHCGNDTYGSDLSVSAGKLRFWLQTCEYRLASTELRDSTIYFRNALIEREQQSRDELLRLARGLDGVRKEDGDAEPGEKREHSKDNKP
jgi:hypothetical protein